MVSLVLFLAFQWTAAFAGESKGTIGMYCVDLVGTAHYMIEGDESSRPGFEACVQGVVRGWERERMLDSALRESCGVDGFSTEADELIRGYATYHGAMSAALQRLRARR